MNSPQLTNKVAEKILSLIDAQEASARESGQLVPSRFYTQLADLYHFQKDFTNEAAILKRFARLSTAANDDLVDIYDRIDRVSRLSELSELNPTANEPTRSLSLVPDFDDQDNISIASTDVVSKRVNRSKKPFGSQQHKVLTVCAAYTGRTDKDEIIQLALVLTQIDPVLDRSEKLETFVGIRKTNKSIPNKTKMQFALNQIDYAVQPFDRSKIIALFEQADMVVSHNDADIERKLLATLIPEVAEKPWYSSQKDIPWGALGFESKSLTLLSRAHGEKAPHSCLERATRINKLINKLEPCGKQTYLERLYNMQPMKAVEWTPELRAQLQIFKRARWLRPVKYVLAIGSIVGIFGYLFQDYVRSLF